MIVKFRDLNSVFGSLEIENCFDEVQFRIIDSEIQEEKTISISHNSLFELIGQLLRIQAEIKKEASNG